MRFELESHNRNVPEEDLLNELRRIANLLDSPKITIDQFNEHAKFHSSTLSRRFGSWFKALDAAGLERTRNLNLTNEQLFENLVTVWLKLGRQPKYDDMKKEHSLFSAGTYDNRFGTWRKGLEAFVSWANEGISPELAISADQPTELRRGTRNINWRLRAIVLMRDGARCQMCGAEARNGAQLHVDHILPWSKGGTTTLENLRILCNVCNIGKSNIEVHEVT
jgi:Homing endonuclease associated repeat/HNH endonuclease